jgi:hypothetical protein
MGRHLVVRNGSKMATFRCRLKNVSHTPVQRLGPQPAAVCIQTCRDGLRRQNSSVKFLWDNSGSIRCTLVTSEVYGGPPELVAYDDPDPEAKNLD